ncbi:MAG: SDR family NAD(P)-dependent oxidoreductase [Myxococcales bacterium]|nr:SDR family NAD(P)-dependent oxidoreductase [Myxococcales bacterium]MCB9543509.1 SDR family NAD(P)-dependent oxidoreductase [Myxococcales bacterium]
MPAFDLRDRVALITGAAGGIGRALAEAAAARGMALALGDIDETALTATADALRAAGARVVARRADVRLPADHEALRDAALTAFGAIHLLVNNAGVGAAGSILAGHLDDWRHSLDVNLYGVLHGLRAIVPAMIDGGQPGHIVNVASLAGVTTNPGFGPYTLAKHGVVLVSETLAQELTMAGHAPRLGVSAFCPGYIQTALATNTRACAAHDTRAPDRLRDAVTAYVAQAVATGMHPAAAAAIVLDAVEARRFWIFTHPFTAAEIRKRTDAMLAAADAIATR